MTAKKIRLHVAPRAVEIRLGDARMKLNKRQALDLLTLLRNAVHGAPRPSIQLGSSWIS